MESTVEVKTRSREPKYTAFSQQELPAFKPLLTPKTVIATFISVGAIFIPIGVACLVASQSVVEVSQRYDHTCEVGSSDLERQANLMQRNGVGSTCTIILTVHRTMKAPVFLYYELDNFYQNHRRYVKSRSDQQLRGQSDWNKTASQCQPELYLPNTTLPIDPCGLIAWSYFNDTYQVFQQSEVAAGGVAQLTPVAVSEHGIAWKSDRQKKYGSQLATNFNTEQDRAQRGGSTIVGPINLDEHFMVWMRTAALPNFRKLWGRIDSTLAAGSVLHISIANRYNTYRFGGQKKVVFSTTSWLGGRNDFLGIVYLVVGGASFVFGLVFFILHSKFPRKLGNAADLSWNREQR